MADKKFTVTRRIVQNTVTRYNYYYHAKLKLEGVLRGINRQRQDNYNVFLPFYPYTVAKLNLDVNELDSVIEKASVTVQIHDPRGRWIDDAYLLIGKAYYYKGDWENASNTFKYINATFAPKKKSEYNTVVGRSEDSRMSVSTREKEKLWTDHFRHKSARNEAFLWQARVYLEQKHDDEAQSLLNLLEGDPYFPKRLHGQLAELQAYRFYKQGRYPETIAPLREAIAKGNSGRDQEARMNFILGQLYASQGKPDSAMDAFRDVIALKPDATIDFNARVQIAKCNTRINGGSLEESIAALQSMLRKERFIPFRDGIYYNMAALCANEQPERAVEYLQKALRVESNNSLQKTLSYKGIADIYYAKKDYQSAQRYYDSTAAVMGPDFEDAALVTTRKDVLGEVAAKIALIRQEDSLQRIAAMSPALRDSLLSQQVAAIRTARAAAAKNKEKEKNGGTSISAPAFNGSNYGTGAGIPVADAGGDWYFYNTSLKSTGFTEFRRRWGNRPLADNWRRSQGSAGFTTGNKAAAAENAEGAPPADVTAAINELPTDSINTSLLASNLPVTPEKLAESRGKQMDAWFDLGKLYHDKLDNPRDAIASYDSLLTLYPDHPKKAEILYSLYVWHDKMGNAQAAARYKQMVLSQFAGTAYANILQFGLPKDENKEKRSAVSALYDSAYLAYTAGRYDTVLTLKRLADSTYGYTSLQARWDLLEAMTVIKTGGEQQGKEAIASVIAKYPGDGPILEQAKAIQAVLENREALTARLNQLQITRDSGTAALVDENISIRYPWQTPQPNIGVDSAAIKRTADSIAAVTAAANTPPPPPPPPVTPYRLGDEKAAIPHFVVMYFERVNTTLLEEAVNRFSQYNGEKHAADKLQTASFALTPTEMMVIIRVFPDEGKALTYYDEVRSSAASTIVPRIRPSEYKFFIISRDNFILLNNTKDVTGYRKFFDNNYYTE
ncbi:type IX secretion system periplasmic lipoprotein PorW/SprE [Chitinophaga lutea]